MPKTSDDSSVSDLPNTVLKPEGERGAAETAALKFSHDNVSRTAGTKPVRLGDYELVREIGRGGMGVVYEALELPLNRRVALKVLPKSMHLHDSHVRRFHHESRAVAQLNHAHIVPVYAMGESDGTNYFAMQLVSGVNLSQLVKSIRSRLLPGKQATTPAAQGSTKNDAALEVGEERQMRPGGKEHQASVTTSNRVSISIADYQASDPQHPHSVKRRAAEMVAMLGQHVAEALHHAHEMGIVHRDVKPSNLLLDEHGHVWVTDFGLAQVRNSPSMTQTGLLVGTYRYMSPEQAAGRRSFVDHRTDIYSLGVTLYELLTLRPMIAEKETEKVLQQVALGTPQSLRKKAVGVPDDLAIIIEKAMSRNPSDRYETAADMADDLERFLNRQPILAKPPNILKRCLFWLSRHRNIAAAGAVGIICTLLTSVAAAGLIWNAYLAESAERERTEQALSKSESLRLLANANLQLPMNPGLALTLAVAGAPGAPGLEANSTLQEAMDANHEFSTFELAERNPHGVAISPDGLTAVTYSVAAANDSISVPAHVYRLSDGKLLRDLDAGGHATSVVYSPDGRYLLTTSRRADLEHNEQTLGIPVLWDAATGAQVQTFKDAVLFVESRQVFHPHDRLVVLPEGNDAALYDLEQGRKILTLRGHTAAITSAQFSPDGKWVLTTANDGTVRLWDSNHGKEIRPAVNCETIRGSRIVAGFASTSESFFVRDGVSATLHGVQPADNAENQLPVYRSRHAVAGLSNSIVALFSYRSTTVSIVSGRTFQTICKLSVPSGITDVILHPTRQRALVISGSDLIAFDTETGEQLSELKGHQLPVTHAQFFERSDDMCSVSTDGTMRLWHMQSGRQRSTLTTADSQIASRVSTLSPVQSQDGKLVATASLRVRVTSLRTADGKIVVDNLSGKPLIHPFTNEHVVTVDGKKILVTNNANSRVVFVGRFASPVKRDSRYLPASHRLVVLTEDGKCAIVDIATNARLPVGSTDERITKCAASDDGRYVLFVTEAGRYFAVNPTNGIEIHSRQAQHPIDDIDVREDGKELLLAQSSGIVSLWKTGAEVPTFQLAKTPNVADRVCFVADDTMILTWNAAQGGAVRCWHADSGEPAGEIEVSGQLHLSDHRTKPLVAIGGTTGAKLWDFMTNETIELTKEECTGISLSDSGVAVLSLSSHKTNRESSLTIFPLSGGEPISREIFNLTTSQLAADTDSGLLAVGLHGYCAEIYEVKTGRFVALSPGHRHPLVCSGFSADSNRLTTVSDDGCVNICETNGSLVQSVPNPGGSIHVAAIDRKGQLLVTAGDSGELLLWNTNDGTIVGQLPGHTDRVTCLRVCENGTLAVSVDVTGQIRRWDLRTREADEFRIETALAAEISPDGRRLLVIGDAMGTMPRKAWLIDVDRRETKDITQEGGTRDAQFSADGRNFGLLHINKRLEIFDTETQRLTTVIPQTGTAAIRFVFAADGQTVAMGHSDRISCWSVPEAKETLRIPTPHLTRQNVTSTMPWNPFLTGLDDLLLTDGVARRYPRNPLTKASSEKPRQLLATERMQFHVQLGKVLSQRDEEI